MDQHLLWPDLLMNTTETQNLSGSAVFPGDVNMPYIDLSHDEAADMSIWSSAGPSSSRSSRHPLDHGSHEQNKGEHSWTSPLTINGGQGSRTEETQPETSNMLLGRRIESSQGEATNATPMESRNLDLNSNHLDGGQSFSQHPSFTRNTDHTEMPFSVPFLLGSSGSGQVSSVGTTSLTGSSTGATGFLSDGIEDFGGTSSTGRRLSRKRKNIDGASVSAGQSANTTLSISSSSNYPSSGANSTGEQLNPRIGTPVNAAGNTESSQRNCRIRITPPAQLAASFHDQWQQGNSFRSRDPWSAPQSSNSFVPFVQTLGPIVAGNGEPSDSQQPVLPPSLLAPSSHTLPGHATSSSRTSSSLVPQAIAAPRSNTIRADTNSSLPRNTSVQPAVPVPVADIRQLIQHSSSWSLAPTSQAGTSSRVVHSPGMLMPPQNPSSQLQRRPPVVARRLIPSIASGSSQTISAPPQPSGISSALQEFDSRAAVLRSLQHMRASSILGDATSLRALATRESRSRVLSEIRNVLARRGGIEGGVYLFDHPAAVFYGGAVDVHDRHRDMRLDVDNMSYEELLALTERIGNVNTGLSEEIIMKCLKQRKYISLADEASNEVEPCCVCQEEYVEEDAVGRLDCGHDFHTACIKQWLTVKNLCPICKTTGLATSKEK